MSYQIAIIIQAGEGKSLSDMISVNRGYENTTQIGWWIPQRGENDPPEKWTMNIADIYLKTDVTETTIEMRQTKWNKGLYDKVGTAFDGYTKGDDLDDET